MTLAMHGETIVVTGATGFIGRHAVRNFVADNDVHVLARDRDNAMRATGLSSSKVHGLGEGHPTVRSLFEAVRPSAVFHLATRYEPVDPIDPGPMVDDNVRFGLQVLDAAAAAGGCIVVLAGSHFQYSGTADGPISLYAATKLMLLDGARYLEVSRGLEWIEVVFYDVYGQDDHRGKLIDVVVEKLRSRDAIRLPGKETKHHFVHVSDAVSALVAALIEVRSAPKSERRVVFATSDELASPREVLEAAAASIGVEPILDDIPFTLPLNAVTIPTEGPRPARWKPTIGLTQGIEMVVRGGGKIGSA